MIVAALTNLDNELSSFKRHLQQIKPILLITLAVLTISLISCSEKQESNDKPSQDTVSVSAPIRDVVVASNPETNEHTVFVLSAQLFECHKHSVWNVERLGDLINIEVFNLQPVELPDDCAESLSTTQNEINIGSDYEFGNTYTVVVNGFSKVFIAGGENLKGLDVAKQEILEEEKEFLEENELSPELPAINLPVISNSVDADWDFETRKVIITVLVTTKSEEPVEGLTVEVSLVGPVGPDIQSVTAKEMTAQNGIATFDAILDKDGSYMFSVEYINGRGVEFDKNPGESYLQIDIGD